MSFCLQGRDGSLGFAFYLKNQTIIKKQNTMCRMGVGTKCMTKNKTEGLAQS
jgi:hypothetical protein